MTEPLRPALGTAEAPPAPPLEPHSLHRLLQRRPGCAAAVLAAMRPRQRRAQLAAQAHFAAVAVESLQVEWAELPAHLPSNDLQHTPPPAPIEPLLLALAEPHEARQRVDALCPAQRAAQAIAQAAWLHSYGYPVSAGELLAAWERDLSTSSA